MADDDGIEYMFIIHNKLNFFSRYSTIRRYSNGQERRSINIDCEICGSTTTRYCMMKWILDLNLFITFFFRKKLCRNEKRFFE